MATETTSSRLKPYGANIVLVADDDLGTRAATTEILIDHGYTAATARNGLEALELLRNGLRPVAIVVDLYMPLMDGEAFCNACDQQPELALIPRILISGNPSGADRQRACRAFIYLAKPLTPDALVRAVQRAVREGSPKPVPVT